MRLTVQRERTGAYGTFGKLFLDGIYFCETLEPVVGPMLIPAGTYPWKLAESARFNKMTPHLQDVPGHTAEEIHVGNFVANTRGCTLVGRTAEPTMITDSDATFVELMSKLPPMGQIEYSDDTGGLTQ